MFRKIITLLGITMPFLLLYSCAGDFEGGPPKKESGAGKAIMLYAASDGTDIELYLANSEDGSSINLTNNETNDLRPFPTPDGSKVAWTCDDGNNAEVCVFDVVRKRMTQITESDEDVFPAMWIAGGKRLIISTCQWTDFKQPNEDCENTVIDVTTGVSRKITNSEIIGLPKSTEKLMILSASPASDLMIIGDGTKFFLLNTQNFSIRYLNTGNKKYTVGPWLNNDEVLFYTSEGNETPSTYPQKVSLLSRSGQFKELASDIESLTICEGSPITMEPQGCRLTASCPDSLPDAGFISSVVALTGNGKADIYDAKRREKKTISLKTNAANTKIICNASDRIIFADNERIDVYSKSKGTFESDIGIPGDAGTPTLMNADGTLLVLTSSVAPAETEAESTQDKQKFQISAPLPNASDVSALQVKVMELPEGKIIATVQGPTGSSDAQVMFTSSGKQIIIGNDLIYNPMTGKKAKITADIVSGSGIGPMAVLQSKSSIGPLVLYDEAKGQTLSLSGSVPPKSVFLNSGSAWMMLTDKEFERLSKNMDAAGGFSPNGQAPSSSISGRESWPVSDQTSADYCPFEVGKTCKAHFTMESRDPNTSFNITVQKKNGDPLPDFMKFNPSTDCRGLNTGTVLPPPPWDYGAIKKSIICEINITPSESDFGSYDLVAMIKEGNKEFTLPIHIEISEASVISDDGEIE